MGGDVQLQEREFIKWRAILLGVVLEVFKRVLVVGLGMGLFLPSTISSISVWLASLSCTLRGGTVRSSGGLDVDVQGLEE